MSRRRLRSGTSTVRGANSQSVLRGRRLLIVQTAWVVGAVLAVAVFIPAVPAAYMHYRDVCPAGAECRPYWEITPEDLLALQDLRLSVGFYALYRLAVDLVYTLGFWTVGAIIFWKRPGDKVAMLFSAMLVAFGTLNIAEEAATIYPAFGLLGTLISYFGYVSFFLAFFVFPDGRLVPRWARWPVVLWAVYTALLHFLPDTSHLHPRSWPPVLTFTLSGVLLGTMALAQVYRYRRVSGPVERQQTKWVVFGLAAAVTITLLVSLVSIRFPVLVQPGVPKVLYALAETTLISFSLLLIPLSISIAILHHRLWDIDMIINRTIVYGSLSAVLAAVFAITDTLLLPNIVQLIFGEEDETLNAVISAVIIAVLFEPLRRRIKVWVKKLSDWLAGSQETSKSPNPDYS
jgi:hypothetical protein